MSPLSTTENFENKRWAQFSQRREFRHDAALLLVSDGGPVLDIGCGDGLMLSMLKQKGIAAEGIDISAEAVARCNSQGLVAKQYDPNEKLPYSDSVFETVILLDVLEHVYDPEALLKEAARIAKNYVIVGVPNFSSFPARIQVMLGRVPENNQPHKGHVYWFNRLVIDAVAHAARLQEVDVLVNTFRPVTFIPGLAKLLSNLLALSFVIQYKKSS